MKKNVCSALMIVAGMLLITTAQCQVDLTIEKQLDLEDHYMNAAQVADHDAKFQIRFKYDDFLYSFDMTPKAIKINDMTATLYLLAKDSLTRNSACNDHQCVTGMRITLGMENNGVVYFFQPVYLIQKSARSTHFIVRDIDKNTQWRYDNGAFVKATDLAPTRTYLDRVRINRFSNNSSYERAVEVPNDVDWKGDTKSIIYTFQEVYGVHNKAFMSIANRDLANEEISFHNGSALFERTSLSRARAKHLVYLTAGPKGAEAAIISTAVDHSAANFAHLCPPSCQDLNFD